MAGRRLSKKDLFLLVLTICVVVGGVYIAWSANVDQRVFLVNGLDVPTQVAVDGQTRTVGPGHIEISLHRGVHQVRVTGPGGELLEEGPIDVPSGAGAVAYNVLGAAPLYTETIIYGAGPGRKRPPTVGASRGQASRGEPSRRFRVPFRPPIDLRGQLVVQLPCAPAFRHGGGRVGHDHELAATSAATPLPRSASAWPWRGPSPR